MKILPLIAGLLISLTAWATDPTYDATKRELTIPRIVIGDTTYMNLVVQLDSVKIVDMGGASRAAGRMPCQPSAPKTCRNPLTMPSPWG